MQKSINPRISFKSPINNAKKKSPLINQLLNCKPDRRIANNGPQCENTSCGSIHQQFKHFSYSSNSANWIGDVIRRVYYIHILLEQAPINAKTTSFSWNSLQISNSPQFRSLFWLLLCGVYRVYRTECELVKGFCNLDGFGLKIWKNWKTNWKKVEQAEHTAIKIQVILGINMITSWGSVGNPSSFTGSLVYFLLSLSVQPLAITSISFVLLSQCFQCFGSIIMQWLGISWSCEDLSFFGGWLGGFRSYFWVIFVILDGTS